MMERYKESYSNNLKKPTINWRNHKDSWTSYIGSIAQQVERHTVNVMVVGSSPTAPAKRWNIAGWTGEAPARSHKPNDVGSNPTPATNGDTITKVLELNMPM